MRPYQAIDCNYYDELEALATLHREVPIRYRDTAGRVQNPRSVLVDFFIREKVEFLRLRNDLTIRLDDLLEVNGLSAPPNRSNCAR